ncbi:MAG: hemerythrin domain-containing protein [Acidimicrobiales bacterium]
MGGVMIWKVLWDYHKKIENLLNRYTLGETQLLGAILEEIEVYGAVEDEVVFPVLNDFAPTLVEAQQESHDRLKDLSADIQNLDPGDPDEARLVKRLQKQFFLHTSREEKNIFPVIKRNLPDEMYVMARQAFAVRQELVAARGGIAPPGQYFIGLPTGGWSKSKVVGGGW